MERFTGYYDQWTKNRLNWIVKNYGNSFFKNKYILDIGGGKGHLVEPLLSEEISSVEIVEGRYSNFSNKFKYSLNNLEYEFKTNLNKYDIVLNFGILYHITNWELFLLNSLLKTKDIMFFETEVLDDDVSGTFYSLENSTLYDQAISGLGSRPTEFAIESFLDRLPFVSYEKIVDGSLNADFHCYDWENKYNFTIEHGLRRFYVVKIRKESCIKKISNYLVIKKLKNELYKEKTIELLTHNLKHQKITEDKLHQIIMRLDSLGKNKL